MLRSPHAHTTEGGIEGHISHHLVYVRQDERKRYNGDHEGEL